jgi:hypothetical protein
MHFGNFTEVKGISQYFSDCGLHNDQYTNNPNEKGYEEIAKYISKQLIKQDILKKE